MVGLFSARRHLTRDPGVDGGEQPRLRAPARRAACSSLVSCGTSPSPASYNARAYSANPSNAFWATLHAVGLTPERLTPHRYPELLAWRIGLTDLNKTEYGSDHELR